MFKSVFLHQEFFICLEAKFVIESKAKARNLRHGFDGTCKYLGLHVSVSYTSLHYSYNTRDLIGLIRGFE